MTTVSTHLRKLTMEKKLIEEVVPNRTAGEGGPPVRTRGGYRPPTRSPQTSYRALYGPAEVLHSTFYGLAEAYPPAPARRLDALLDFARVLGLTAEMVSRVGQFVEAEKVAVGRGKEE